ncbi:uncharacterized protein L199_002654 [Kwoniella botswanensis]|uniref:uncharacterized protein n=1 Tax=Kwoniella botswanensis TaxID=1268659 RepID=UPI00315CF709
MDNLTKSLLQDAIDIATRRNCTMVLESIIYRDGYGEWRFEEIADVQGPDAIPTAQIDVTTDGFSTRQVPYDEARRIWAGDSDDRDWEERRPGLQLFVMEIAVPHENQE